MADRFRELLKNRDYIIFDGAMGTMLQAAGMKMGETPEVLNITRPELLVSIAEQYFNAGSDTLTLDLCFLGSPVDRFKFYFHTSTLAGFFLSLIHISEPTRPY